MFLVLTTLESYAARAGRTLRRWWPAAIAGVFAANAVVRELYQSGPGSGRSGDPYDSLADLVGIALGGLAFRLLRDRWVVGWLRRQGGA
jgi:hypothetical protein